MSRKRKLVVRRVLAREIGVDVRTTFKLQDEGMPVERRGRGGRPSVFDVEACRAWKSARDEALAKDNGHHNGHMTALQARAFKDHQQGLLAQQRHEIVKRTLIPASEMEAELSAEVAACRSHLLSWEVLLTDRVTQAALVGGRDAVASVLKSEVHQVLTALGRGKHRALDDLNGREQAEPVSKSVSLQVTDRKKRRRRKS